MPEMLRVNERDRIIEVDSHGVVTGEENRRAVAELLELITQTGFHKVLADTRGQQVVPSLAHLYHFGASFPVGVKIALIVASGQPTAADVAFLDDVAYNRGTNIRLFPTREDALAWLLG
ncbi:MAG: hypothetical protein U0800_09380 [Isosphaeraceae bacterium]